MTVRLRQWWGGLSLRERWLVGMALALSAAVVGWTAVYAPLTSALVAARETHAIALERQAVIAARVKEIRKLQAAGPRAAPINGSANAISVTLVLAQGAAEQGLTLSRNEPAGDTAATIAIASAQSSSLVTWLTRLESMGLTVTDLSLRPNADGTVAMTASIRRAQ